jgi:protein-L-isoaspartate O-methyltransferase
VQSTPVRDVGTVSPSGVRLLREVGSTYRDGAEEAALQIVTAAQDRRSTSDEMVLAAVGWAQRYHFDPARANIVRCLDLAPTSRVLEIGAGCGAITRYLGETCAVVDALEPVPARAEVARVRTADQPNVDVAVGLLADVPAQPAYDVVVVIGVLEYVGEGTADLAPYQGFLADVAARLVDGGTLVLAIENRLGVKYVVGAPEDHTNRMFDSIEGYPRGGRARTFSRRELEALLVGSGLQPATRIAFPDYKMPRAVFGDLPEEARSLLHRIPEFPSPDWRAQRPRLADERSVWRTLVDAGLETEFGNSFLVLAGKGAASALWPAERGAMFWSSNRLPHLMMQTNVAIDGGSVRFRRTFTGPQPATTPAVRALESDVAYVDGTDLPVVIAQGALPVAGPLLAEWLTLLDAAADEDPASVLDFAPHNMVVGTDGRLHVIDIEFAADDVGRDQALRRGIFWLGHRMTPLAPPERWEPCRTVGEVMRALGALVGLPEDGSWLEQAIEEEATLITRLRPGPPAGKDAAQWLDDIRNRLHGHVDRPLDRQPLGLRLPDHARRARENAQAARAQARSAREELRTARAAARAAQDEARRAVPAAQAKRSTPAARRLAARAFPRGTRRRRVLDRLAR